MNYFEQHILPQAWKDVCSGKILSVLESEAGHYHKFAKQPDTGENFRRFYALIEPLHSFMATNAAMDLNTSKAGVKNFALRIRNLYKALNAPVFFRDRTKIVVLKGTIDLAHGDVLRKQLYNLSATDSARVGLILIDYGRSQAEKMALDLGVAVLPLGEVNHLKDKYSIVALGIAAKTDASMQRECIWWGIPFGMIFTYQLAKNIIDDDSAKPDLDQKISHFKCKRSFLTVKHHHSFSSKYLDKIYSSTPLVDGFGQLFKPEISSFPPSFYDQAMLSNLDPLTDQRESKVFMDLLHRKQQGFRLFSSASRVEKTCSTNYISTLKKILQEDSCSMLICFGKSLPANYQELVSCFGVDRIFFAGWLTSAATVKIIGILDLFLDPFPFGAGMTFASAGYQGVPIVSTRDYVATSPSTISILYYYYSKGHLKFKNQLLEKNLFSASSGMAQKCLDVLDKKDMFHASSQELRCVVQNILMDSSSSVLSSNSSSV